MNTVLSVVCNPYHARIDIVISLGNDVQWCAEVSKEFVEPDNLISSVIELNTINGFVKTCSE